MDNPVKREAPAFRHGEDVTDRLSTVVEWVLEWVAVIICAGLIALATILYYTIIVDGSYLGAELLMGKTPFERMMFVINFVVITGAFWFALRTMRKILSLARGDVDDS